MKLMAPVGMPDPLVGETVPEMAVDLPWTKLVGFTLSVVLVGVKTTLPQLLISLATSTDPSPVARS